MGDQFDSVQGGLTAPASMAYDIVPNSSADLATVTRAVYIGSAGDLAVVLRAGTTVTFRNLQAGALLPLRIVRVLETTTAGNLVGLA